MRIRAITADTGQEIHIKQQLINILTGHVIEGYGKKRSRS